MHETFGRVDNPLYSVRLTSVTRVNALHGQGASVTSTSAVSPEMPANAPKLTVAHNGESKSANDPECANPGEVNGAAKGESQMTGDATVSSANDTPLPANELTSNNGSTSVTQEQSLKIPANNSKHIKRSPPPKGTKVYYVSKFSKVLGSWRDIYTKGYDASNEHDEEVPEEELEFSDDEKEAEAKRLAKKYVIT